MGVIRFYGRWVKTNFPDAVKNTLPHGNDIYLHTLEFDMGGIIHDSAAAVYSYGDGYDRNRRRFVEQSLMTKEGKALLQQTFYQTITDRITQITLALIKETNYNYKRVQNLVIAMDGVAVFAKIAQQRSRRYRSAINKDDSTKEKEEKNKSSSKKEDLSDAKSKTTYEDVYYPPPAGFDSNAITPGTDLMEGLDRHMLNWITTPQATALCQNNIIYSSTSKRGEGEHKLFQFRHEGLYGTRDEKGIIAIFGLDADLIMLNALDTEKQVYIIRERNKHTPRYEGNEYHASVLNIDKYREGLVKLMTDLDDISEMNDTTLYNYIRDFTMLCFLIGNDFLPHLMCMINIDNSIDLLIELYKDAIYVPEKSDKRNILKPKKGFLTKADGSIVWSNFLLILEELIKDEPYLLGMLGKSIKTDAPLKGNFDSQGKYFFNPKVLRDCITLKHFPQTETAKAHSEYILDFPKFRTLWYSDVLGPKTPQMKAFVLANKIEPFSTYEIEQMCKLYLQGLQWNLMYYTLGLYDVSRTWYYIYTQAPLAKDICEYLKILIQAKATPTTLESAFDPNGPNFGPVHQLVSVLPPKSINLINKYYTNLLTTTFDYLGPLSYISPLKFNIDYESAITEHQSLCILPIVDPWNVIAAVDKVKKPANVNIKYLGKVEDENIILKCDHYDSMKIEKKIFKSREGAPFKPREPRKVVEVGKLKFPPKK